MADNMDKTISMSAADGVPVKPADAQYNRYNMALPQSFSIYNDEGSVLYRGEVEQMANQLRAEIFGIEPAVAEPVKAEEAPVMQAEKAGKAYDKKRVFFFILPLVLSLAMIAVFVVGLFLPAALPYVSIYKDVHAITTDITALDPAIGFVTTQFELTLEGLPTEFVKLYPATEDTMYVVGGYALSVATVLYAVFTLVTLIVSIVGLAGKKREDGTYKKVKLGFVSIVCFLCALIVAAGGLLMTGAQASDILGFFTGEYALTFGYGLIAMVAVPVIVFICTCLTYRKKKN